MLWFLNYSSTDPNYHVNSIQGFNFKQFEKECQKVCVELGCCRRHGSQKLIDTHTNILITILLDVNATQVQFGKRSDFYVVRLKKDGFGTCCTCSSFLHQLQDERNLVSNRINVSVHSHNGRRWTAFFFFMRFKCICCHKQNADYLNIRRHNEYWLKRRNKN